MFNVQNPQFVVLTIFCFNCNNYVTERLQVETIEGGRLLRAHIVCRKCGALIEAYSVEPG